MKTTTRNRIATIGVAAVTGLTGIGFASSPALAAAGNAASNSASPAALAGNAEPVDATTYADQLVRAWGVGSDIAVAEHATNDAIDVLLEHGDESASHWDRTGAEGTAGTVYVDYENKVTGEKMSVGVSNQDLAEGKDHAVHHVSFSA